MKGKDYFPKSCKFTGVYEALSANCVELMFLAFPLKGTPQHRMRNVHQITVEITLPE